MNDDLDDIDLHAWQAPPPPRNLADAVIARVNATGEAIAVETHRRGRRRYTIAAGGLAAALAASVALWLGVRGPVPTDEQIGSDAPRHVELGGIVADLGPGAMLRTHRVGDTLNVVQSGTATWSVSAHDHLVIGAGSSTSIDATGASLRVEATMNLTDVRIVSGAALTAAAVALATVVVYEGHAKVTGGGGQTIIVQPANVAKIDRDVVTLTLAPSSSKSAPIAPRAGGDLAITAGESVAIHSESGEVTVEIHSSCNAEVKLWMTLHVDLDVKSEPKLQPLLLNGTASVDGQTNTYHLGTHAYHYTATCVDKPELDGSIVIDRNDGHDPKIGATNARVYGSSTTTVSIEPSTPSTLRVLGDVTPGTSVAVGATPVVVTPPDAISDSNTFAADVPVDASHPIATVRVDNTLGTHFYVYHIVETLSFPCIFEEKRAAEREAKGDHAGALDILEATECKLDRHGLTLAFTYACNAGNAAKAREYLDKLPLELHDRLTATCKITRDQLDRCDVDADADAGASAEANGDHATALTHYENEYRCKPDPRTLDLAFMTACNGDNAAKARKFWRLMTPENQNKLAIMCVRNNISRDQLDGAPASSPACDVDAEVTVGSHAEANGDHATAFQHFQTAYRCKSDQRSLSLMFMAACNGANVSNARESWRLMTAEQKSKLEVMCVRNRITRAQLDAP